MAANKSMPIHISFDVDALDPVYISSTGTRVDNGMHPEEVRSLLIEGLRDDQLKSFDCVEFNPELGDKEKSMHHLKEVFRDFFPNEFP